MHAKDLILLQAGQPTASMWRDSSGERGQLTTGKMNDSSSLKVIVVVCTKETALFNQRVFRVLQNWIPCRTGQVSHGSPLMYLRVMRRRDATLGWSSPVCEEGFAAPWNTSRSSVNEHGRSQSGWPTMTLTFEASTAMWTVLWSGQREEHYICC